MTELQKVELDLLRRFIDVCTQLNLTYYLVCGSALGAAKYGGFIPWDDDIDVGMPRKDYEMFIRKAPEILPQPYFLQNYRTEPAFPMIYSKLRNSNTTYIEKTWAKLPLNHGVYIDIFPLDGYPSKRMQQYYLEIKKRIYSRQNAVVFDVERGRLSTIVVHILRGVGCHRRTRKRIEKYTKLISSYQIDVSDLICNHGNWQGRLEYAPAEQYGGGVSAKFEGLDVRIPEKYDAYLTQKYGYWRAELPEDQRVGHHYYEVCDLERPYLQYLEFSDSG